MKTSDELKNIVKETYAEIATQKPSCGCGCSCSGDTQDFSVFVENYTNLPGYVREADLGLGCGLPTEYAGIKAGDAVLDLGSGAGNDCFVASAIVGDTGHVTGLDFTEEMVQKANLNKRWRGTNNIDFVLGDIESMPFEDNSFDVIISNCVLNLVPDKTVAFSEMYRVLKSGGHFCISDIILKGELPEAILEAANMYASCVSGALKKEEYLTIIEEAGFSHVEVKKIVRSDLPDEVLLQYLSKDIVEAYRKSGAGIFSITVVGHKI
ncbi:MAG: arsenite methyltransferase [Bacteroidales bacterium]|nr:arsenite methyltransferase [Bacteroidales bacterium]